MTSDAWRTVALADVAERIDYRYTAEACESPRGPKFLRITDIVPAHVDWESVPYCEIPESKLDKFRLEHGDIVIARTGATVGYAKRLPNPPESVFASYLVRIRPSPEVDGAFLGHLIESSDYKHFIKAVAGGAAQPNANAKVLGSYKFKLPPIDVQRNIGAVLQYISDLIDNNWRRIEILEEVARLIYREWFVHLWFPGHEDCELVDSELGGIPAGWEVIRLSQLVSTQYGYTESARTDPVGPRYLRGMDMNKASYIDWSTVPYCPISTAERRKYKVDVGDVFVIRMADPGKVGICETEVDAVFASYLVRLRAKDDRLTPYFLFFTLSDERYQGWVAGASTGATRRSISAKVMTEPLIVLPPRRVQKAFQDAVGPVRELLTNLLGQNATLQQTRDLLLPRLISGALDVSDLEPRVEAVG